MKKMKVKTGFGYIKDVHGNIISKYELPNGQHPIKAGFEYTECATKEKLEQIKIYEPPRSEEEVKEEKIQNEIRSMAIERLQLRGEL